MKKNNVKISKSKSIDSAGANSAMHDMLKPKGIEVRSTSVAGNTSQDVGTP